ncbi:phage portal protein [Cupriavidus sp. Agwp_2]|uniref:phage portal protein n=1 Tax=Cupriavidus sp. Agwp_2 TaxID=2897324 RepID=UPI00345F5874
MATLARNVPAFVRGWWASANVVPTTDGLIPTSYPWNYWQMALPTLPTGTHPAVEGCVRAISQAVAMLPCRHWRRLSDGGRVEVINSAAHRVMRRPNAYQTRADFFLNLVRAELLTGNGVAVAVRNARFEVDSLHIVPPDGARPFVWRDPQDATDVAVFYGVTNVGLVPMAPDNARGYVYALPARDVLHLRQQCDPNNPLEGVTPLTAAALSMTAGTAILGSEAAFFTNFSKPSGVLETEQQLTPKQMDELRAKWLEFTQGANAGGTPILGWGVKWKAVTMSAQDAQIIDVYKMTTEDIARVFGVPLPIIGALENATLANVQSLTEYWLSTGLGFVLEHIESALDSLFGLPDGEWMEFDTAALLRTDFTKRVEGLTKAITGGLLSPNEARAMVDYGAVEGGDLPRVQQQQVPLTWEPAAAPAPPAGTPPPADGSAGKAATKPRIRAHAIVNSPGA